MGSGILAWKIPWTQEPSGLHGVAVRGTQLSKCARTTFNHYIMTFVFCVLKRRGALRLFPSVSMF